MPCLEELDTLNLHLDSSTKAFGDQVMTANGLDPQSYDTIYYSDLYGALGGRFESYIILRGDSRRDSVLVKEPLSLTIPAKTQAGVDTSGAAGTTEQYSFSGSSVSYENGGLVLTPGGVSLSQPRVAKGAPSLCGKLTNSVGVVTLGDRFALYNYMLAQAQLTER